MKLGDALLKQLGKKYEPSSMVQLSYKGYDIMVKTDEAGNAVQAFVGKLTDKGTIRGDRYARTLKHDRDGKLIKDHWEREVPAS